ncbi:MAG: ABC transporter permease [Halobacteriovoraceae bacterium]|nr:ABC transporter permease [Halobacteriovoraceae bacterium]
METARERGVDFAIRVMDDIFSPNTKEIGRDVLISQIYFTGYQALKPVVLLAFVLGVLLIWGGHIFFLDTGQIELLYPLIISGFVSDLAPITVSLIILIRSGSAITTELGYMKVNKEVALLKAKGISPISYLVTPRLLGTVLSGLLLISYFAFSGIFLAYLFSTFIFHLQYDDFFRGIINAMSLWDVFLMILKVMLSTSLLTIICCYQGLKVSRAYTEIPGRVINALTTSLFLVIFMNLLLTVLRVFL